MRRAGGPGRASAAQISRELGRYGGGASALSDRSDRTVPIQRIVFDHGRQASAAILPTGVEPTAALSAPNMSPARALILVSGAAASLDTEIDEFEKLLVGLLTDAETLRQSWARFSLYDSWTCAKISRQVGRYIARIPTSRG